eukprot:6210729-Lingulodinium_polyedra.AAC.1
MAEGINEWFVYRRLDCLWVGLNAIWARSAERHPPLPDDVAQCRCPRCGQLYRPWQEREGLYIKANKVFVLALETDMYLPGGPQKLVAVQAYVFPAAWPSTSTQNSG